MTHPIVMDVIARDNASKTFKDIAKSQTTLAKQTDGLSKNNDNLRKSQLSLIAAQERYNRVAKDSSASAGKLASAQSSLIGAQQRVRKATDDAEKSTTKAKRSWSGAATAAAVAGVAVIGLGKSFVQAASDQQKANAQTAAVIKSTGGAAHVTAQQIGDLTGSLAKQTGIQDDTIQSGANMLLTFTNIRNEVGKGNDIFNQATKVVTDMSVALGQDMPQSAIQLGKALNDPIKGVTALQRVGVTFTQQQKDQIKVLVETGRTMDAQKIILAELNKEFGGSAAAQATAAGKMSVAWDNFKESAGNALLPVLDKVFGVLSNLLDIFSRYSGVLVPAVLALGGFAAAIWAVNVASRAWLATQTALTTVFGPRFVAGVGGAAAGLGGLAAAIGPAVVGFGALLLGAKLVTDAVGHGDAAISSSSSGIKDLTKSLKASGGVFDETSQHILANTLVQGNFVEKAAKAHLTVQDLTAGITGNDEAYKSLIERWKAGGKPSAETIILLGRIRDGFVSGSAAGRDAAGVHRDVAAAAASMTSALDGSSNALVSQQKFLDDHNLTVETATQKYFGAVAAAHTFTAELGYMSKALDTLSNNNINATLQQDALNLAMGTAADKFAGSRAQVAAHGKALQGNTADAISNRDWALQQIQAINQQAISYATSTGSIGKGTQALGTNIEALKVSMRQAGFTREEIDKLIQKYAATPDDVTTSVRQQGAQAVLDALGDIAFQLHAIADPVWKANLDISSGARAAQGGQARAAGGYIAGPGGPTSDVIPIMASNGEFMVNARSTARHRGLLENINRNKYAGGGLVGDLNIDVQKGAWADMAAFVQSVKNAMTPALPPGGVAAPGNITALQAYAASIFGSYGWGQGELGSLIALWNGESGWNPGALNSSSGAYGIPQSLPASKMASAGADWATNGATQIRWGEGYIKDRYGSPSAAYSFWLSQSPHWYGKGMPPTVFRRPTLIGVGEHGPETVSVSRGVGGGGVAVNVNVYAAQGMSAEQVGRQVAAQVRAVFDDQARRAAKGGRA